MFLSRIDVSLSSLLLSKIDKNISLGVDLEKRTSCPQVTYLFHCLVKLLIVW